MKTQAEEERLHSNNSGLIGEAYVNMDDYIHKAEIKVKLNSSLVRKLCDEPLLSPSEKDKRVMVMVKYLGSVQHIYEEQGKKIPYEAYHFIIRGQYIIVSFLKKLHESNYKLVKILSENGLNNNINEKEENREFEVFFCGVCKVKDQVVGYFAVLDQDIIDFCMIRDVVKNQLPTSRYQELESNSEKSDLNEKSGPYNHVTVHINPARIDKMMIWLNFDLVKQLYEGTRLDTFYQQDNRVFVNITHISFDRKSYLDDKGVIRSYNTHSFKIEDSSSEIMVNFSEEFEKGDYNYQIAEVTDKTDNTNGVTIQHEENKYKKLQIPEKVGVYKENKFIWYTDTDKADLSIIRDVIENQLLDPRYKKYQNFHKEKVNPKENEKSESDSEELELENKDLDQVKSELDPKKSQSTSGKINSKENEKSESDSEELELENKDLNEKSDLINHVIIDINNTIIRKMMIWLNFDLVKQSYEGKNLNRFYRKDNKVFVNMTLTHLGRKSYRDDKNVIRSYNTHSFKIEDSSSEIMVYFSEEFGKKDYDYRITETQYEKNAEGSYWNRTNEHRTLQIPEKVEVYKENKLISYTDSDKVDLSIIRDVIDKKLSDSQSQSTSGKINSKENEKSESDSEKLEPEKNIFGKISEKISEYYNKFKNFLLSNKIITAILGFAGISAIISVIMCEKNLPKTIIPTKVNSGNKTENIFNSRN